MKVDAEFINRGHRHTCVSTIGKVGHASNVEVAYIHDCASYTLGYINTMIRILGDKHSITMYYWLLNSHVVL